MSLSDLSQHTFVQYFGGLYEHSPWVAERAFTAGLTLRHDDPDVLCDAFSVALRNASVEEKMTLIRAHPDLVGKAAIAGDLTQESTTEQASAGLDQCTAAEYARFNQLNDAYKEKFGFPFVMAVRYKQRSEILQAFEHRLDNTPAAEFECALVEINKIARLRLDALLQQNNNLRKVRLKS